MESRSFIKKPKTDAQFVEDYTNSKDPLTRQLMMMIAKSRKIVKDLSAEELERMSADLIECVEYVVNTTKKDMERGHVDISRTIESSFQATQQAIIRSNKLLIQQTGKVMEVAERQMRSVKRQWNNIRIKLFKSATMGLMAAVLMFLALILGARLWIEWEMISLQEQVAMLSEEVENRQQQLDSMQSWGLRIVEWNGAWWMLVPQKLTLGPTQNLDDGRQAHELKRR